MPKENEPAGHLQSRETGENDESLTRLCVLIRDYPFEHIKYERHFSYDELIDDFARRRRGACSAKHYFLGEVLSKKQFKVKYVTTPFLWQDLAVDYPIHLKKLADLMPVQLHLSLEVESNGIEIPIDATWDRGLEKASFPISHFENGIDGNIPAVRPIDKEIVHNSGLERFLFVESVKSKMDSTGMEPVFYKKLNLWLDGIRQS